jgi:4-aminobutyrate aminotransferase-like enzyme
MNNERRTRHIHNDGPFDSVIKTKPALCFTKENAKEVVENIDKIPETYYNNI